MIIITEERELQHSFGKILSYSTVWFMDAIILAFYGVTVFYFYEVEIGIPAIFVAIAYGIFAIWNMINDPLSGYLTEKPRSWSKKYGLRTPWIILGAFSSSIVFVFIFLPLEVNSVASSIIIFIYLIFIVCFFDLCYSIFNQNFAGGIANMFRTDQERRKVGGIGIIFSTLGVFLTNAIILPNFIEYGNKGSFLFAALITFVIMLVNSIILIPGVREPEDVKMRYFRGYESQESDINFIKILKIALKKKNFVIYIIVYLFFAISYNLFFASQIYFAKDVLNEDLSVMMVPQIMFFIGFLIAIPIWLKLAKKIGNHIIYGVGYILFGSVFFSLMWISTVLETSIAYLIGGFFYACSASILIAIQSDVYDEITIEIERHQEATLQGVSNFFIRIAYLFIGIIISVTHVLTLYNPDPLAIQSPLAILGVRIHTGLIAAILLIIGGILFLIFYDIKEPKKEMIRKKLAELKV
ncbi:MAG: MFS transporter [Promethearchaeota archaeon]